MITVAVYGYIQPFKHLAVNILEIVLSINTLILLLLRNTENIEDSLGTLGQQPLHSGGCQDEVEGVTDFVWLLLPVYYLPLLMFCTVGLGWGFLRVR